MKRSDIFASITLPLVLLAFAIAFQYLETNRKFQADYTKIAVSILTEKPTDGESVFPADVQKLREWAVDLLNEKCPVKVSGDVRETIITGKTPISWWGGYDFEGYTFHGGYDYDDFRRIEKGESKATK